MHEQGKKKKCRSTSIFFFNGWPVPPGWKPPLTQRHGNTVKPSPAHPHKERARESRGWGELCTQLVLQESYLVRLSWDFGSPAYNAHRGKKGRGHSHSYLHWSAINTQTMKAFAGTTEAAGQLGKDAWKQTKKKKLFFFLKQTSWFRRESSRRKVIYFGEGAHVWMSTFIIYLQTKKTFCWSSVAFHMPVGDWPCHVCFSDNTHLLPLRLRQRATKKKNKKWSVRDGTLCTDAVRIFVCSLPSSPSSKAREMCNGEAFFCFALVLWRLMTFFFFLLHCSCSSCSSCSS